MESKTAHRVATELTAPAESNEISSNAKETHGVMIGQWQRVASGTEKALNRIWGRSSNDVWAVGSSGTALHYDGNRWNDVSPPWGVNLYDIWGDSEYNVFVVHDAGSPTFYEVRGRELLHFDGAGWSFVAGPPMMGGGSPTAIWGASGDAIFVVGGNGIIYRYDGVAWRKMIGWPPERGLMAIVVPYALYASVGEQHTPSRWPTNLVAVWGSSESDVYATAGPGNMVHYDGKKWSVMESPELRGKVHINGTSRDNIFVTDGGVMHFDGKKWTTMKPDCPPCCGLGAVWSGAPGKAFFLSGSSRICYYDGAKWTKMESGTKERLTSMWGASESDVWAVGAHGTILHYTGK
jgi:hypothetical protein